MGNVVGFVFKGETDSQPPVNYYDLSKRGNDFINANRKAWDGFMLNFGRALKNRDQRILDSAIEILRKQLDAYNPTVDEYDGVSELEGELIWNDLWEWLVKNNKEEVF